MSSLLSHMLFILNLKIVFGHGSKYKVSSIFILNTNSFVKNKVVLSKQIHLVLYSFIFSGPFKLLPYYKVFFKTDHQFVPLKYLIDCPDGLYGINSSRQCRYPNYGKDCQQDCSHCNREMCNSTVGCLTLDGTIDRGTYEL